jgi:acyl-CoA synthetase (AMP-forming)/AMP-acid ligase II
MPKQIEELVGGIPGVSQVYASGLPDERWGDAGCLWIVPEPGAELDEAEILEVCREPRPVQGAEAGDSRPPPSCRPRQPARSRSSWTSSRRSNGWAPPPAERSPDGRQAVVRDRPLVGDRLQVWLTWAINRGIDEFLVAVD